MCYKQMQVISQKEFRNIQMNDLNATLNKSKPRWHICYRKLIQMSIISYDE